MCCTFWFEMAGTRFVHQDCFQAVGICNPTLSLLQNLPHVFATRSQYALPSDCHTGSVCAGATRLMTCIS